MTKKLDPRRHEDVVFSLKAARERAATERPYEPFDVKWACPLVDHKRGWTPAPDYSKGQARVEYKGRDYATILEAAKRKPVGYWQDAPHGMKFAVTPVPLAEAKAKIASVAASSDDPYEPVGTDYKPGDVVVWFRADGTEIARTFSDQRCVDSESFELSDHTRILKRKPVAPDATIRAWSCVDGWVRVVTDAEKTFMRHPSGTWVYENVINRARVLALLAGNDTYTEFPPDEAQRLWRECAAALKLDQEKPHGK